MEYAAARTLATIKQDRSEAIATYSDKARPVWIWLSGAQCQSSPRIRAEKGIRAVENPGPVLLDDPLVVVPGSRSFAALDEVVQIHPSPVPASEIPRAVDVRHRVDDAAADVEAAHQLVQLSVLVLHADVDNAVHAGACDPAAHDDVELATGVHTHGAGLV